MSAYDTLASLLAADRPGHTLPQQLYVGRDAAVVDVLAVGAVPAGNGDFELTAVTEIDELLDNTLTVALLANDVSGTVVVKCAGGDF